MNETLHSWEVLLHLFTWSHLSLEFFYDFCPPLTLCRLRVIRSQHHIEALVEHRNGQVVVSASTREWAIKKHLYSTKSVVACESVGRVLAQRCLEAGINFMVYQPTPWEASSDSIKRLQNAMTESGVMLREPRRIYEWNRSVNCCWQCNIKLPSTATKGKHLH